MQQAVAAVAAGAANTVLVYRAFNERSGHRFGQPHAAAGTAAGSTGTCRSALDTPAKMYSLWFQRYMHTLRR